MNKEKLTELADLIQDQQHYSREIAASATSHKWDTIPQKFSMKVIHAVPNHCQTVGCILGFGLGIEGYTNSYFGAFAEFTHRFSLPMAITKALCDPANYIDYRSVTPKQAAQAVRNVIAGKTSAKEIWEHVIYR